MSSPAFFTDTDTKVVMLISCSPAYYQLHEQAISIAKSRLEAGKLVSVFFYGDGAYTANRLIWQTADVPNVQSQWQDLAKQYGLSLPVCVSTALARGISDVDNAKRHGLQGDNLLQPFYLTGLSELAMLIDDGSTVLQYTAGGCDDLCSNTLTKTVSLPDLPNRFVIHIDHDNELIAYEAMSLGFVLASFDHSVQFVLGKHTLSVLQDTRSRPYGMIQSLDLYDLPPAICLFDKRQLDETIARCVQAADELDGNKIDGVLLKF